MKNRNSSRGRAPSDARDAAERVGCTLSTLLRYARGARLDGVKIAGRWWFPEAAVVAMARTRPKTPSTRGHREGKPVEGRLTVEDAMRSLGLSKVSVYWMLRARQLPGSVRSADGWSIPVDSVRRFADNRRKIGVPESPPS